MDVERRRIGDGRRGAGLRDERVDAAPRAAMVELREDRDVVLVHRGGEFLEVLQVLVVGSI